MLLIHYFEPDDRSLSIIQASLASLLDQKTAFDFDRGPKSEAAERILRSWQFQATGKVAAASALVEVKAEHIPFGGPLGVQAVANKHIEKHGLEDTFYVVDLGNVLRMYKVTSYSRVLVSSCWGGVVVYVLCSEWR